MSFGSPAARCLASSGATLEATHLIQCNKAISTTMEARHSGVLVARMHWPCIAPPLPRRKHMSRQRAASRPLLACGVFTGAITAASRAPHQPDSQPHKAPPSRHAHRASCELHCAGGKGCSHCGGGPTAAAAPTAAACPCMRPGCTYKSRGSRIRGRDGGLRRRRCRHRRPAHPFFSAHPRLQNTLTRSSSHGRGTPACG